MFDLTITAPADGLEVAAGSTVDVTAEVSDDHEGFGWKVIFYKDDVLLEERPVYQGETAWNLAKLAAGVYRVRVEAVDHDRNIGADEVTIHVGVPAPATDTEGDSEGGTETTGETAGESTGDDTAATSGGGAMEEGCACHASGRPTQAIALVLLAGIAVGRRRRART